MINPEITKPRTFQSKDFQPGLLFKLHPASPYIYQYVKGGIDDSVDVIFQKFQLINGVPFPHNGARVNIRVKPQGIQLYEFIGSIHMESKLLRYSSMIQVVEENEITQPVTENTTI